MPFDGDIQAFETKIAPVSEARRVMQRAIVAIETHGWSRRQYGSERVGFCMVGALNYAAFGDPVGASFGDDSSEALFVACDVEAALVRVTGAGYVPKWNDAPGRTKEEVLWAMRKAEALL